MTRAGLRTTVGPESGFTVIELAVTMAVLGVLLTLSGAGWSNYQSTQAHVSAASEVVSTLRTAQMRATAEAATYRVDVDASGRSLTVLRYDGSAYVPRWTSRLEGRSVLVAGAGFRNQAGSTTASAYFYPRGTASPGEVVLGRQGSTKQRTVSVEGLTGRVSTS